MKAYLYPYNHQTPTSLYYLPFSGSCDGDFAPDQGRSTFTPSLSNTFLTSDIRNEMTLRLISHETNLLIYFSFSRADEREPLSPIIGAHVSMIPMREGWIFLSDTWGVPNLFAFARTRPACMHGLTSLFGEVSFCTVSGRQRIV